MNRARPERYSKSAAVAEVDDFEISRVAYTLFIMFVAVVVAAQSAPRLAQASLVVH